MTTGLGSGAGGQLQADNTQLAVAVTQIDDKAAQIRSLMQKIRGEVSGVSGAAWAGDANGAFQNAMSQWDTAAVKMDKVLADIQDGVHQSRMGHEVQEDAAVTDLARAGQITFGI